MAGTAFKRSSRPPPSSLRRTAPALNPAHPATASLSARRSRPLVYAVAIAAIVASGAIVGAILKTDRQKADAQARQEEHRQGLSTATATEFDYRKSIESLETRRAQLLAEKLQFERKIFSLKDSQARKQAETLGKADAPPPPPPPAEQANDLGQGLKQVDVRR